MRIREENSACQAFRVKLRTWQEIKRSTGVKAKRKLRQTPCRKKNMMANCQNRYLKTEDTNLQH